MTCKPLIFRTLTIKPNTNISLKIKGLREIKFKLFRDYKIRIWLYLLKGC